MQKEVKQSVSFCDIGQREAVMCKSLMVLVVRKLLSRPLSAAWKLPPHSE